MTPGFDADVVLPDSGKHAEHGKQLDSFSAIELLRPICCQWGLVLSRMIVFSSSS